MLFFHGLAGLENACDAGNVRAACLLPARGSGGLHPGCSGPLRVSLPQPSEQEIVGAGPVFVLQIAPGTFVLFNGASFLADLSHGGLQLPADRAAELLMAADDYPTDTFMLRRYQALVEQHAFSGGIYVQVNG